MARPTDFDFAARRQRRLDALAGAQLKNSSATPRRRIARSEQRAKSADVDHHAGGWRGVLTPADLSLGEPSRFLPGDADLVARLAPPMLYGQL